MIRGNGSWPRAGGGEERAAGPKVQNSKGFRAILEVRGPSHFGSWGLSQRARGTTEGSRATGFDVRLEHAGHCGRWA